MRARRRALLACLLAALAPLGACREASEPAGPVELVVFAASSLTEAVEDLARGFGRARPGVAVLPSFAGSQVLRLQIEQGAAVDVFASANEEHMRALVDERHVTASRPFAGNELVVIVPRDNPAGLERFRDLPKAQRLVVGASNVPVGAYAAQVIARAGAAFGADFVQNVRGHVVSEESNVRLVRAKVELGEADAALVYRTDAAESEGVRTIAIPPELNVRARYSIGTLARSKHPEEAAAFLRYVLSPAGRAVLRRHHFGVDAP